MRENGENWESQLNTVICEITGLCYTFDISEDLLILLSKLEGLKNLETDFDFFRKTVFESITLLRGSNPWLIIQN